MWTGPAPNHRSPVAECRNDGTFAQLRTCRPPPGRTASRSPGAALFLGLLADLVRHGPQMGPGSAVLARLPRAVVCRRPVVVAPGTRRYDFVAMQLVGGPFPGRRDSPPDGGRLVLLRL